jgi:hypothetical protein
MEQTATHPVNATTSHSGTIAASKSPYRVPEVVVIGRAVNLVLSFSSGKYSDGYTGYYWER